MCLNYSMEKYLSIILLAHKNVDQIKRLLRKLEHSAVDVYLHLDKKFKISKDEIVELSKFTKNVHILPQRYSVNIVDSSVTKCILASCEYFIHTHTNNWSYVALMSAQDYPIKPIEELLKFLNANYPKPYIDCTPYSLDNWVYHKFCHSPFYGRWYGSVYQKHGVYGKIGRHLVRMFDKMFLKVSNDMFTKLRKHSINLYGGSQWWILPLQMVKEILEITKREKVLTAKLFNCIPDEIFFQTIGMMTSFADKIELNPKEQISQNSLTYANFAPPGKVFCGHPYIIKIDDWAWLKDYPHYIARKFDINVDREIFDIIDNNH